MESVRRLERKADLALQRLDDIQKNLHHAKWRLLYTLRGQIAGAWQMFRMANRVHDVQREDGTWGLNLACGTGLVWYTAEQLDSPETFAYAQAFGLSDEDAAIYWELTQTL